MLGKFGMILELFGDLFLRFFPWGDPGGIIGGTRLGVRGTAAPGTHNTILYRNSKNGKGKPGWGTSKLAETFVKSCCGGLKT